MSVLEKYLEDPGRLALLKRAGYGVLGLLALVEVAAPMVLYEDEAHFPFENWPAFGSVYGFIACVAIIVVSKAIGKLWLMRSEDYYGR
jgi:hypothetical protein